MVGMLLNMRLLIGLRKIMAQFVALHTVLLKWVRKSAFCLLCIISQKAIGIYSDD